MSARPLTRDDQLIFGYVLQLILFTCKPPVPIVLHLNNTFVSPGSSTYQTPAKPQDLLHRGGGRVQLEKPIKG